MKYLRYFEELKINHKREPIDIIMDTYFESALWSVEDKDEDFKYKTIHDFSDQARNQAKEEIKWFLDNAGDVFSEILNTEIGHDLWLSRNGHGSGFFDRAGYEEDDADFLMDLARILGEIYLEIGDDDKIYFIGGSEKYKDFDLDKYFEDVKLKKAKKKYNI